MSRPRRVALVWDRRGAARRAGSSNSSLTRAAETCAQLGELGSQPRRLALHLILAAYLSQIVNETAAESPVPLIGSVGSRNQNCALTDVPLTSEASTWLAIQALKSTV